MRDFKSFTPTEKQKKQEIAGEAVTKDDKTMESVEKMIKDRESRTEDELMKELVDSVNQAKSQGKFNQAELENFKKTVLPFLSNEQTKRLEEILKALE